MMHICILRGDSMETYIPSVLMLQTQVLKLAEIYDLHFNSMHECTLNSPSCHSPLSRMDSGCYWGSHLSL